MKKLILVLAIALFSINVGAQEAKPTVKKEATKKECCSKDAKKKHCSTKDMTPEEIEKCKAKCKAEGKTCTTDDKKKAKKDDKCCAKKS